MDDMAVPDSNQVNLPGDEELQPSLDDEPGAVCGEGGGIHGVLPPVVPDGKGVMNLDQGEGRNHRALTTVEEVSTTLPGEVEVVDGEGIQQRGIRRCMVGHQDWRNSPMPSASCSTGIDELGGQQT